MNMEDLEMLNYKKRVLQGTLAAQKKKKKKKTMKTIQILLKVHNSREYLAYNLK